MKAWHFLQADKRLRYDGRHVRTGRTLKAKGDIILCRSGMHASTRLIDALKYAPGPIICRVDVRGEIVKCRDKIAGRERTVEWMIDGENLLHRFACRVAEMALKRANITDERCWNAINTKLKWLRGEVTEAGLAAARDAALDAAWAAWDAAWAARDAASAVRDAAWAASDAAWAASWAASDIARAAARDAARDEHNRILTAMVAAEHRKRKGRSDEPI